jgi:hypothetical protein
MAQKKYIAPKQSRAGQLIDSLFLLVLVYVTLFAPLVLGLTGGGTKTELPQQVTWETLGQNATMQAQWEKLGYTPESAADIIAKRFDYTIDPLAFGITAVVIIAYFVLLLRLSEKEYGEVIREKFSSH